MYSCQTNYIQFDDDDGDDNDADDDDLCEYILCFENTILKYKFHINN